jgi:hypothetical protein
MHAGHNGHYATHNDLVSLLYIAMKKNRNAAQFFLAQIFLPYPVLSWVNLQVFFSGEAQANSNIIAVFFVAVEFCKYRIDNISQ